MSAGDRLGEAGPSPVAWLADLLLQMAGVWTTPALDAPSRREAGPAGQCPRSRPSQLDQR